MSGFGMLVLLSACDDEIDPAVEHEKYVQEQKEAFAETFTEMFGEIPADQSWDFSKYGKKDQTRAVPNTLPYNGQIVGNPKTKNEWYELKSDLIKVFKEKLNEKNTNTKNLGQGSVNIVAPNSKFTIYPVFQGLSLNWDLYMKVGTQEPKLIWQKSHNIEAIDENGQWRKLGLNSNDPAFTNHLYEGLTDNLEWWNGRTNSHYDFNYTYGSSGYKGYCYWYEGVKYNWYGPVFDYYENGEYKEKHAYIPGLGERGVTFVNEDVDRGYMTTCYASRQMESASDPIKGIRTKGYTFDLSDYAGQPVTFYLEINTRSKLYRNVSLGAKMWSTTNQMRFINKNDISGLNFSELESLGKDYMLVGIEDSDYRNDNGTWKDGLGNTVSGENLAASDYDYNDLVLLIISDDIKTVTDEYDEPVITKKRYMVEDLGTTDDIDFNDMVVDIEQAEWFHYRVTKVNGVVTRVDKTPSTTKPTTQKATIRAMGGTLDFDFKIGSNVVFKKSTSTYNSNSFTVGTMYNTEKNNINYDRVMWEGTVSGWNPSTNNVSFTVYKKGSSDPSKPVGTYDVVFPELGTVPYIIAFDPSKQWRDERHPICKDWLAGKEPAQWEWPEPHNQNGDMSYEEWKKQNP